ncbi:N-acetylmuramoyl-L-alanine amidase [Cytobacillus sp. Hm23]
MKVVLDAGHGYHTPGKRTPDNSMREWEFNSAVAKYAKELLLNYKDIEVRFTHDSSGREDVTLTNRTSYANNWDADVFVSIHANAAGHGGYNDVTGIETFVYVTNPKNARILAETVQKQLVTLTGRKNRGVKTANYTVLRQTMMDAILCECEFMTNKEAASLLKDDAYRQLCAKAIVKGLVEHYQLEKSTSSHTLSQYEVEVQEAIEWAKSLGISNGERLNDFCTRSQAILMLYRVLKSKI